jgi:glucose/arabinose dehydrogenase
VSIFGSSNLEIYDLPFEDENPSSGPFEALSNHEFMFVTKCGDIYRTRINEDDLEIISKLPSHIGTKTQPLDCEKKRGVKDSLIYDNSLFVSYTTFNKQSKNAQLVIAEFDMSTNLLKFRRTVFTSEPPIKFDAQDPFAQDTCESGGTLAIKEQGGRPVLFVAVGDFDLGESDEESGRTLVQDDTSSIGKIVAIDLTTASAEIYAKGIRSPTGGLFYDPESDQLWEAEHGPLGGDEINLILKGKNYGWPNVTYGLPYPWWASRDFSHTTFGQHEGFEKPKFVFVPSIGIGRIARYPSTGKIESWRGDLFAAGMGQRNLFRLRLEGSEFRYAESVLEGYRIRDLHIGSDGAFFMKTDNGQLLVSRDAE